MVPESKHSLTIILKKLNLVAKALNRNDSSGRSTEENRYREDGIFISLHQYFEHNPKTSKTYFLKESFSLSVGCF